MSNVQQLVSPQWDLLPEEYIDPSTVSYEMRSYSPRGGIVNSAGTDNVSTAFNIQVDNTEDWIKMSDAMLYVKAKIVKNADGTDFASTDIITICSDAQAIFRNMQFRIAQKTVHQIQNPGHASLVRNIMEMSKDYAETVGEGEGFLPEYARTKLGAAANFNTTPTLAIARAGAAELQEFSAVNAGVDDSVANVQASYNPSYVKRFIKTQGSQVFTISIPLQRLFPWLKAYQSCTRGFLYELILNKETAYEHVLHGAVGVAAGRLIITDLQVWCPSLVPSVQTLSYLESQLASQQVSKILYENWETHYSPQYSFSTTSPNYRDIQTSYKPLYLFVGFQNSNQILNQADTADVEANQIASANPMQFTAGTGGTVGFADVNSVTVLVNSRRFPLEDYQANFVTDDYARVYNEFLRVTQKAPFDPEDSSIVDYTSFKYQYPIWAFDLRASAESVADAKYNIEIRAQTAAGASGTYRMVAVLCTEQAMLVGASGGRMFLEEI